MHRSFSDGHSKVNKSKRFHFRGLSDNLFRAQPLSFNYIGVPTVPPNFRYDEIAYDSPSFRSSAR
jgi:hypothetical protein